MANISQIQTPDGKIYNINAKTVNGHTVASDVQANKVLVTDGNGAIVSSDVSRQRLSELGNTFSIVNGKVCITYDDGQ